MAEEILAGEVLATVTGQEKCTRPFAVVVERIVKFPLNHLAINPFIAANVLEEMAVEPIQEGFKTEAQEGPILREETSQDHKTTNRLRRLTANWTKYWRCLRLPR